MIKEGKGSFYIGNRDNPDAVIEYVEDEYITINHTFVSESLRGFGVAKKLLDQVVLLARLKNKKIIPLCSYAKEKLNSEEYKDILI